MDLFTPVVGVVCAPFRQLRNATVSVLFGSLQFLAFLGLPVDFIGRSVDYFCEYMVTKKYASEGCTFTYSFSMMTGDEDMELEGLRRNSSSTNLSKQKGRVCYAHAAVNAYRNTLYRIFGLSSIPPFQDMLKIAMYKTTGGRVEQALERLENFYRFGVMWRVSRTKPSVEKVLKLSICVSFATTSQGWNDIAKGNHTGVYRGKSDGRHASLIEGYDFERSLYVCKNSWGDRNLRTGRRRRTGGRFKTDMDSMRNVHYVEVFFRINSIRHLRIPRFPKEGIKILVKYDYQGEEYAAALMTEVEGKYNSDFVVIGQAMGYSVAITLPLFVAILRNTYGTETPEVNNRIVPVKGFNITFNQSSY